MKQTRPVSPPPEACTETELPAEFIDAPARFVQAGNEGRLIQTLRDAAKTRNPYEILAQSATAFFRAQYPPTGTVPHEEEELGTALADLAVTGRRAYCLLATPPRSPSDDAKVAAAGDHVDLGTSPYTASELETKIGDSLAPLAAAAQADTTQAVNKALDRAFRTAWAIRGPLAERAATRADLGWIAVSSEDDMAHRPTNVPGPPFEQYEISVTVPKTESHKAVTLRTRFVIASPLDPAPAPTPHTLRELPPDPEPSVPEGNNVILFLHGHVSGAEEALEIIPHLHAAGLAHGTKFSIIAVDLPNSGYSESFDHEKIADSRDTLWPSGPLDREPIQTPVLDFIEDFVVAFVDALDKITPIKERFSGVFGGSLGGNLGLRLGRRNPMPDWLDKAIVSWNAASVWDPMVNDHIKSQAPGRCMNAWEADEVADSRRDYFYEVYEKAVIDALVPFTQPQLWYRMSPSWEPCKALHIEGSRRARREAYSENLRKWHWRVAGEQLIFSHVDRVDRWDNASPWRYELNVVKHLLIGSAGDNFIGSNIYDATRKLADLMGGTPGTSLFLRSTGHSVHFERPRYLAKKIVDFLPSDATPPQEPSEVLGLEITCIARERPHSGRILAVSGTDHTRDLPFSLTVEECIDFIDFGCDVYVTKTDGDHAGVHPVRKSGARPYIATNPDKTDEDNLLSLPTC